MQNPIRTIGALVAAVRLVRDPNRLDEVFSLADKMGDERIIREIVTELSIDPQAARAFVTKPRVGKVDLRSLAQLPEGSLGRVFAVHMIKNGLDPSAIPTLEASDDFGFLRAHLYETHDIWHAVTGFGADVAGELGLQAFFMAQIPSRLAPAILAGGMLNTLFYAFPQRDARMQQIVRGWLLGKRARSFFGIDWASLWETPIDVVRARLGVDLGAVDSVVVAPLVPFDRAAA